MKKGLYNCINVLVLLLTAALFFCYYKIGMLFNGVKITYLILLAIAVVIVHFLKAIRLFLALYGTNISFASFLKIYCKVTPVSILFPYKTGEIFRMYCFAEQTGDPLKGVITVVLDRFMDTIGLLTMIFAMWILTGSHIASFSYILFVFCVVVFIAYKIFPEGYLYWNRYLLSATATNRRIRVIKLLAQINIVYKEIDKITKGRGVILYFLSLLAWATEIGSISLIYKIYGSNNEITVDIYKYLSSALSSVRTVEFKQFIFMSVVLMISVYVIVKICERMITERGTR